MYCFDSSKGAGQPRSHPALDGLLRPEKHTAQTGAPVRRKEVMRLMDVNYAARRKKKWKKALTLVGFIGPFFFMLFLFKILPIIANVGYSFQNVSVSTPGKFIWLKNWTRLMKDELFWTALKNTFTYLLYVGPVNIVFGFLFALLLNQKLRGRIIVRGLVFFPYVLMTTVVGVIWRWMLNGSSMGILNHYLSFLGIDTIYWLTQKETAMLGVAIASIWWTIGYNTIIYLAALQDIPRDVIEAACLDGANGFQRVVRVYIPLVKGSTFFVVLTTVINSMQMFGQVYVMTAGGPSYSTLTLVQYLYIKAFRESKLGYASAIGVALLIILIVLSAIIFWLFRDRDKRITKKG